MLGKTAEDATKSLDRIAAVRKEVMAMTEEPFHVLDQTTLDIKNKLNNIKYVVLKKVEDAVLTTIAFQGTAGDSKLAAEAKSIFGPVTLAVQTTPCNPPGTEQ